MRSHYTLDHPLYGIHVYEENNIVRLSLKGITEYFSIVKYKSVDAAIKAAQKRRNKIFKLPMFKYQVNGKPVRNPRSNASVGITGICFSLGRQYRNGSESFSPTFAATLNKTLLGKKSLRLYGTRNAFHICVHLRYQAEGRPYNIEDVDKIFYPWFKENQRLLARYDIYN